MGLAQENKIEKKNAGKYYTPDDVAIIMAQYLLELPGENICDLCCGTGNLIFAVLNELGEEQAKEKISNGNIYLYDIDETAVNICLAILKNRYGNIVSNIHIITGDCLNNSITFPNNSKIISNPPYGKNSLLANSSFPSAKKTKEWYVAFMEKVLAAKVPMVFITPHSFLGGSTFKELRTELYGGKIFSFDNVPGNIFKGKKFGIFNSNEANSTRAAISVLNPSEDDLFISSFIRFKSEERNKILNKDYLDSLLPTTSQLTDGTILYRIAAGTEEITNKWLLSHEKFNNLLTTKSEYKLDIPNTCRYFTTAAKRTLNRSGKMTVYCKDEDSFYLAYAFVNSSLCYYWHRMCNGGITYPITLLKDMPTFGKVTPELKQYCNNLMQNEEQYIVLKKNAGVYQENIKFPMEDRFQLTELLLNQIGLHNNLELKKVHNNSCLTSGIDSINDEED